MFITYTLIILIHHNQSTNQVLNSAQSYYYMISSSYYFVEFCYGVTNHCEPFIYLNLMVKNREVPTKRYFK
jgi:hypothetical protein